MTGSALRKYRLLSVPLLVAPSYFLVQPLLPQGGLLSYLLTTTVIGGLYLAYFSVACQEIVKFAKLASMKSPPPLPGNRSSSVEDRLDDLERLKRRDMVTPEEYAAKRQEILKDL
jgi:hypothetical protein